MRVRPIAGLFLLLAAVAVTAWATGPVSADPTWVNAQPPSSSALANRSVTVAFEVVLDANETPSNISETAVFFDSVSHGPFPFNGADYAGAVAGAALLGTNFSAQVLMPLSPGQVFVVVAANVSGVWFYNETEWTIDVVAHPAFSLDPSATDEFIVTGRTANITVNVSWGLGQNLSEIRLLWDTYAHDFPWNDTANYTTLALNFTGPPGSYHFDFTPPAGGHIYYVFAAEVLGETVFSSAGFDLAVVAEPSVIRDGAPAWVFAGRNASVRWSVLADAVLSYTTELRWDTASHPNPRVASDYGQTSGIRSGSGTASFAHVVDTPTAGNIYFLFVVHWGSQDIYVTSLSGNPVEYRIEVRPAPVLTVPSAPSIAFVGRNVSVSAAFAWAFADDAELFAVVFDNAGHGSPPTSAASYGNSVLRANVSEGTYSFILDAPASPGTLYFAAHVRVGGVDFLSANEYQVTVAPLPVLILALPNWTLPQALASATLEVQWATGLALDSVAVHYDTAPHGSALDPAPYASHTPAQSGIPATFSFTLNAPATPGTLYVIASVQVSTYLFTTAAEAALPVAEPPTVIGPTLDPDTGYALYDQPITVSWTIDFAYPIQLSSDFRWDTASHAGAGMSFSDYPQASALLSQQSTTTFTTTFNAPNASGTLHSIVRVLLLGRNYYSAGETNVTVLANPVLQLDSYPTKVTVGQAIELRWSANFTGPHTLIPHTAIHWGLVSKAPIPPSITNYPGVGAPHGGINGTVFNATLPSQPSPGHVYFIVHVVVNGMHFYLPDEYVVEVALAAGAGGGGFLPGLDGSATVIAMVAAAVVFAGLARRRT